MRGWPSDPISEALYFSFRNAFLKIDWNDAVNARRALGCLYGVEFGATPVLPPSVASMSLVQAFVSAGLIPSFSARAPEYAQAAIAGQARTKPCAPKSPATLQLYGIVYSVSE